MAFANRFEPMIKSRIQHFPKVLVEPGTGKFGPYTLTQVRCSDRTDTTLVSPLCHQQTLMILCREDARQAPLTLTDRSLMYSVWSKIRGRMIGLLRKTVSITFVWQSPECVFGRRSTRQRQHDTLPSFNSQVYTLSSGSMFFPFFAETWLLRWRTEQVAGRGIVQNW